MNELYSEYINSEHWKIMRENRLEIDNYECQICGAKSNLRVHHLFYNDLDNIDSLLTVCDRCHSDIHRFRDVVIESSRNGKLKQCMDAYDFAMAEIVDSFVFKREKTLNETGDALLMTGGRPGRMNKYINALFHMNPYGEIMFYAHKHNCGIGFTRYNKMRLERKNRRIGEKEVKTSNIKIIGSWQSVVNKCRATVGKEELGHDPSTDFKKRILIAEHSPIRCIQVEWTWENIPSWVSTHWSRHKWECFIKTQRSDRTGVDRNKLPQDAPVTFTGIANAQHLIDTWRKRLCYQAAQETREYAEDFKIALHEVEPEISDVLVPQCVYRCSCPEMEQCNFFKSLYMEDLSALNMKIQDRYNAYNRYFWKHKGGKEND